MISLEIRLCCLLIFEGPINGDYRPDRIDEYPSFAQYTCPMWESTRKLC